MALTLEQFNVDNIIFDDVKKYSSGDIYYQRIPIKYMHENKSIELCIATPELVTYGIQENRYEKSYSLPLIMTDKVLVETIESILKRCKDHLRDKNVKKALGKNNLPVEDMDVFYRKREAPTLYAKLFTKFDDKNPPIITTQFYNINDDIIEPPTLIGQRCKIITALKFQNIYVGVTCSIQIKVNDAIVTERLQRNRMLSKVNIPDMRLVKDEEDDL